MPLHVMTACDIYYVIDYRCDDERLTASFLAWR